MKNAFLADEVTEFLMERQSAFLLWELSMVRGFVDYYRVMGGMGLVRRNGTLIGVGMARPLWTVSLQDQVSTPWVFKEDGDTIFIQELVTDDRQTIPVLWGIMKERFGRRPLVAGRRRGIIRVWPFENYESKMQLLAVKKAL